MILEIKDLFVNVEKKEILKGVNLKIKNGEFHVIMGPNGSGKSTLLSSIINSPFSNHKSGDIYFNGIDIKNFTTDKIAKLGIFLVFQDPISIPGLTVGRLLKKLSDMYQKKDGASFVKELREKISQVGLEQSFINRYIGDGFSGGEKKKLEILQVLIMKPKLIMLDEIDSGLDIDSTKIIFKLIEQLKKEGASIILVSHYKEVFNHINPNYIHIFKNGKIVETGDKNLIEKLDRLGYMAF